MKKVKPCASSEGLQKTNPARHQNKTTSKKFKPLADKRRPMTKLIG